MTKKINIQKLIKKHKNQITGFKSKRWSIAVFLFMFVIAYLTQAYLDAKFNPDVVQANVLSSNKAIEAFKINPSYNVHEIEGESYYAAPGDTDVNAFAFGVDTKNETLVLKSLNLNIVGELPEGTIKSAKLLEDDEVISEARIRNNEISFSKFTSIIQPESSKVYRVQVDISEELKSGSRFKLVIPSPYSLSIYVNNEIDYSLGAYPIDGAYVSVVGWRK